MIATILPGSADFHAVGYNEHKVYKGVATLLEMQNWMPRNIRPPNSWCNFSSSTVPRTAGFRNRSSM